MVSNPTRRVSKYWNANAIAPRPDPRHERERLAVEGADRAVLELVDRDLVQDQVQPGDDVGGAAERGDQRHQQRRGVEDDREDRQHDAHREPGDEREQAGVVEPDRHQQAVAELVADHPEQDDDGRPPPQAGEHGEQDGDDEAGDPARQGGEHPVAEQVRDHLGAHEVAHDEAEQRQQQEEPSRAVRGDQRAHGDREQPEQQSVHASSSNRFWRGRPRRGRRPMMA